VPIGCQDKSATPPEGHTATTMTTSSSEDFVSPLHIKTTKDTKRPKKILLQSPQEFLNSSPFINLKNGNQHTATSTATSTTATTSRTNKKSTDRATNRAKKGRSVRRSTIKQIQKVYPKEQPGRGQLLDDIRNKSSALQKVPKKSRYKSAYHLKKEATSNNRKTGEFLGFSKKKRPNFVPSKIPEASILILAREYVRKDHIFHYFV
jgi:hypothetical protein